MNERIKLNKIKSEVRRHLDTDIDYSKFPNSKVEYKISLHTTKGKQLQIQILAIVRSTNERHQQIYTKSNKIKFYKNSISKSNLSIVAILGVFISQVRLYLQGEEIIAKGGFDETTALYTFNSRIFNEGCKE